MCCESFLLVLLCGWCMRSARQQRSENNLARWPASSAGIGCLSSVFSVMFGNCEPKLLCCCSLRVKMFETSFGIIRKKRGRPGDNKQIISSFHSNPSFLRAEQTPSQRQQLQKTPLSQNTLISAVKCVLVKQQRFGCL